MFRLLLACFVICGTVILSLRADAVEKAAAAHKPNVVLIMADDVSWEAFSCYGAEDYKTPHIDSLAARGIRFAHCYSTPICTPSRVQIMTGQYSFRNYTHFGYLSPNEKTIGHLMQSAGYQTAIAGKWQLNGLYNKLPGWEDRKRPQKAGFHESYLWQVTTGKQLKDGGGERFWSPPLERNGVMETVEDNAGKYGPDLLCDFLCDFMERNRSKPFFVYYPMVLVHNPFVKTPDTIGDDPRTQAANKAPKNKTQQKENFVAMVEYMDKIIGRLVKKVESIGQEENTIIVFTADNGTNRGITSRWHGQDIKGGKGGMKDMGTHVPLVASWPGRSPQAAVIDDLVDFTDMYPTFADAAGVSLGKDDPIDGRSFLPQLLGQPGHPRGFVFLHYQPYWGAQPGQFARTQQYKLYRDGSFFDVPEDLEESNDLHSGNLGVGAAKAKQMLTGALNRAPPAPTEPGSRTTVDRPIYADWPVLESE
ncbi:MAG: sulfatase-like hydrolase/transferase [Pirellulales bacterium]|nr:sulfatase-like hydrolase/transferase [Pirellulales bacterium]